MQPVGANAGRLVRVHRLADASHGHLQPASISWTDARRFARIFRSTLWDGVEMTKEQVKTIPADVFEAYTHLWTGGSGSPAREDHPPRKCLSLKQQAKIYTRFGHLFSHGSLTIAHDPNGINRLLNRSRLRVVKIETSCDHLQTGEPPWRSLPTGAENDGSNLVGCARDLAIDCGTLISEILMLDMGPGELVGSHRPKERMNPRHHGGAIDGSGARCRRAHFPSGAYGRRSALSCALVTQKSRPQRKSGCSFKYLHNAVNLSFQSQAAFGDTPGAGGSRKGVAFLFVPFAGAVRWVSRTLNIQRGATWP